MRKSTPENPAKNALEWTVFGISLVLVLATLGLLVMAVFHVEDGPARLTVSMGAPVVAHGWVKIPLTVSNEGQRVAANVEVQVCIGSGTDRREAGFTMDFVPRGAECHGSVSFKGATLPVDPVCEVIGYEEP